MIGYLEGSVLENSGKSLLILCGGVGYNVSVTEETARTVVEKASLYTHLAVRENALDLYGFKEKSELEFFELLITISGIGPKSALSILNIASLESLRSAISSGDTGYLTKVSGIGRKTAEKIVLELRDKVGAIEVGGNSNIKEESDALLALMSLGYAERDVREALKNIKKEGNSTKDLIREALKQIGK